MKQIKFRMWDGKEMDFFTLDNEFDCHVGWLKNSILMQFTGLHDKNGVEIYEGDILNVKTTFENNMADKRFKEKTKVTVGFFEGAFVDAETETLLIDRIKSIVYKKIDYEIIGNIHQNPELL